MEGLDYLGADDEAPFDRFARPLDEIDEEAAALRAADSEVKRYDQVVMTALFGAMLGGVVLGMPLVTGGAIFGLLGYAARESGKSDAERLLDTRAASKSPMLREAQRKLTAARRAQIEQQADDLIVQNAVQTSGGGTATDIAETTGLDVRRVIRAIHRLSAQGIIESDGQVFDDDGSPPPTTPRPRKGHPFRMIPGGKVD